MGKLDEIIHQPVRLRLMAALMLLGPGDRVDFSRLKETLQVTDGNLGAHLLKLEEAGYVAVEKTFVGRKPKTYLSATDKGRGAFQDHVTALRSILDAAEPRP